MHEINTEDVYDDFSSNDEMFDILTKSKPHNDSNKLVIGKKKDENCWYWNYRICCIETKKMHSILADNNEHKKARGVNRNLKFYRNCHIKFERRKELKKDT